MSRFERNQLSMIEKKISEKVHHPKTGVVTQVFEHSGDNDDSNWEVDVEINGGTSKESRVSVHTPGSGAVSAPKNGDKMLLIYRDGDTNRPIALSTGWSNTDRPPRGKAGMYRNQFESGESSAGLGDLNITGYTKYDGNVASTDKRELSPEETFVQIAKHTGDENVDPSEANDLPAKIEMYDSANTGESWITVEINKDAGSDSHATWGMKFNIQTGEWKLVGPSGFGITSDGDGNFVWEYRNIDYQDKTTSTGSLSL